MGHLFLINDSFETAQIPKSDRELVFLNFCKAIDYVKNYPDDLYATSDIYSYSYSYGDIYKLLFGSWQEIKRIPTLNGISPTALDYFHRIMFAKPGLFNTIDSINIFNRRYANEHFGYTGFDYPKHPSPYIKCDISWQTWKCHWLRTHQNEINWVGVDNNFLPNKIYSDEILWLEVLKNKKESQLDKHGGNKTTTFYEEVMKKKGQERIAYIGEIGTKIAKANYYIFELELSSKERKFAKGSYRTIFSLIGKEGKTRYLSIDYKHAMFEYHDHKGKHLGEFRLDGTLNSSADVSHNLKSL